MECRGYPSHLLIFISSDGTTPLVSSGANRWRIPPRPRRARASDESAALTHHGRAGSLRSYRAVGARNEGAGSAPIAPLRRAIITVLQSESGALQPRIHRLFLQAFALSPSAKQYLLRTLEFSLTHSMSLTFSHRKLVHVRHFSPAVSWLRTRIAVLPR